MHHLAYVIVPNEIVNDIFETRPFSDIIREYVDEAMMPFDENLEGDWEPDEDDYATNPEGRWDWYEIGGRWDGKLTKSPNTHDIRHLQSFDVIPNSTTIREFLRLIDSELNPATMLPASLVYYEETENSFAFVEADYDMAEWITSCRATFERFIDDYLVSVDYHN